MLRFLSLCWVLARLGAAVEVPAGLRPAKALGEATAEQRVVPELQLDPAAEPSPPAGARAPPNLSLRSRLIAAQNSAAASQDDVVDRQPVEVGRAEWDSLPSADLFAGAQLMPTVPH